MPVEPASPYAPQGTFLFWPIASRYWCSTYWIMKVSVGAFPHFCFHGSVCWRISCKYSAGEVAASTNSKSLLKFQPSKNEITGKVFSRIIFFCGPVHWRSFLECFAGDIAVLANCKSLTVFYAGWTKITGDNFPAPFFLLNYLLMIFEWNFGRWHCCLG